MQDAAIREHTERLSAAAQAARQLVRKQDTVLKERVEQVSSLVLPGGKGRRKSLFAMLSQDAPCDAQVHCLQLYGLVGGGRPLHPM
jgi:enhancing lycopene biosynthesis protein 2